MLCRYIFFFSSRRRHTRLQGDWSSDVCSSDLLIRRGGARNVREVWPRELWLEPAKSERIPPAAILAACGHSRGLASEIVDGVEQLVRERSRRWPATGRR